MGLGKVKVDKADRVFSYWIRLRDKRCMRCGTEVTTNAKGLPNSHTNSHFFGRRKESVRFDPDNCDTLCAPGCHSYWETEDREAYRAFKIKQLGQEGFDKLQIRANTTGKKDRQLAYMYWKQRLLDDFGVKA